MKDHSIVRIHFSTGLILMKLSRPMDKEVKVKTWPILNWLMLLSLRLCFSGHPVWNLILEFRFFGIKSVSFRKEGIE